MKKKKETRRHHVKQPRITAVIDELADELKKKKKKKWMFTVKENYSNCFNSQKEECVNLWLTEKMNKYGFQQIWFYFYEFSSIHFNDIGQINNNNSLNALYIVS